MSKPVILTGLRANNDLHLGNYLGALLPMVQLQKKYAAKYQINLFVPDLHSFTTPIDHSKLYQQSIDNVKIFVAAGLDLDDENTFVYRQSFIPAHSELTWILNCFTYMGELERMTQYQEKSRKYSNSVALYHQVVDLKPTTEKQGFIRDIIIGLFGELDNDATDFALADRKKLFIILELAKLLSDENTSSGLFNYPVLMAADILLYGAKYVPVGEDQRQHLELTRDLAIRMNNKFGSMFVIPDEWSKQVAFADRDDGVRIRSLRNPEKKMSKSVEDPAGTIKMTDKPEEAAKKIMGATTDSLNNLENVDKVKQPGLYNLIQILSLLSVYQSENPVMADYKNYGALKTACADAVSNFLADFQARLADVDEKKILQKLEADEKAMNEVANETLLKVQKAVGLRKS